MIGAVLVAIAVAATIACIVKENIEYQRYVASLTPAELKEFKEEERQDLQIW